MPNDIQTEHSLDVFETHQSYLDQYLPDFVFVYFHLNVPPIRITDLVRNVSNERLVDMELSPLSMILLLSSQFV